MACIKVWNVEKRAALFHHQQCFIYDLFRVDKKGVRNRDIQFWKLGTELTLFTPDAHASQAADDDIFKISLIERFISSSFYCLCYLWHFLFAVVFMFVVASFFVCCCCRCCTCFACVIIAFIIKGSVAFLYYFVYDIVEFFICYFVCVIVAILACYFVIFF